MNGERLREALERAQEKAGRSYASAYAILEPAVRAALTEAPPSESLDERLARCPLCGDPERVEDMVGGVCLTCADAIAFSQNARRGAIRVQVRDREDL